jgi:CubicO group peptidase (beta-lactamase class C family)
MFQIRAYRLVSVAALTLLLAACGGGTSADSGPPDTLTYTYAVPPQTSDGWATGHLDDHGFDMAKISDMMQSIVGGQFEGIDSVVIVRDNTLLLYSSFRRELDEFDGWINNTSLPRHILHSTSKSVTSALVGIAIDQGYIASIQEPFYDFFNYGSYANWDARKSDMTLEDALTMRLGIVWDEWSVPYGEPGNDLHELTSRHSDFAKALLDLPMEGDPGTTYAYNTAASITIGQALENAVGVPMAEFANTHLFRPMQIMTAEWGRTPTGLPNGGSGLFLEPRDMAKFGQIFIGDGEWNGQQIISSEWIETSTQRHVSLSWNRTSGYGYQWWIDDFVFDGQPVDSWSTRGYGGQYIFCIPALNLVVTFTGQNYGTSAAQDPFTLVQDFILPSIEKISQVVNN